MKSKTKQLKKKVTHSIVFKGPNHVVSGPLNNLRVFSVSWNAKFTRLIIIAEEAK